MTPGSSDRNRAKCEQLRKVKHKRRATEQHGEHLPRKQREAPPLLKTSNPATKKQAGPIDGPGLQTGDCHVCKRTMVKDINILFTDGLDAFTAHCERATGHSGLDENGQLTGRHARTLCTDFYIKGVYSKLLISLLFDNPLDGHFEEYDILFRSGLIDDQSQLSNQGYLKAIATLNRAEQIDYLGLPFDTFEPTPHQQGKRRERYAQEAYSDRYDFVIYDEGKLFQFIRTCFIYSARRYFIDFGFDKYLLNDTLDNPLEYDLSICRGLLAGKPHNFYQRVKAKKYLVDEELTDRSIKAVRKAVSHAIREASVDDLFSDAIQMNRSLTTRHSIDAFQSFSQAFNHLGEDAIRKFMIALIEHPTPDDRGWPDLTAFNAGQYMPIEVKGKDKLTFSQIEHLFWLKNYLPEHAKNQRIAHTPLIN